MMLFALFLVSLFAGFFAGLLGVGGGLILVPFLSYFMLHEGFPAEHVTHMAIATALTSIVFTSLSSIRTHHHNRAVNWSLVGRLVPGIIIGSWLGPRLSTYLSGHVIIIFFVCFAVFSALQMLLNKKPSPSREIPGPVGLSITTLAIGVISSIVGIGGGAMTVPFLAWCNVPMRTAVGVSATMGFPIALSSAIAYAFYGWHITNLPSGSLGYVYVPALLVIASGSVVAAYFGARTTHLLPVATLKKVFAVILLALSTYMIHLTWQ